MAPDEPQEDGRGVEVTRASLFLSASVDQLRTVILAACVNNLFYGAANDRPNEWDLANQELAANRVIFEMYTNPSAKAKKALQTLLKKQVGLHAYCFYLS
jgi:hypothetical protein